jgi:hypothetical protein
VSYGPQHGRTIKLVERIGCINKQKSPLLFFLMLLPQLFDGVDAAFDAGLQASAELMDATQFFSFRTRS